jgi:hypothetical protein
MASKRTGRPRGRPLLKFADDPDRYRLAALAAVMQIHHLKFEPAALLVLSIAESQLVSPSKHKLSRSNEKRLAHGWKLQSFKRIRRIPLVDSQIDNLRLKSKRYAQDAAAQLWLHNMRNAWINLLQHDRVRNVAELLGLYCEAAGESAYAKEFMLPLLRRLMAD